ncbi:transcriptional regulator, TetR family [Paenibacillus uliginis N3/975]|uniref:Transcriptional regulator, TetR family n=1 Tax=Paenibacillus uliginis N3/975 TaxID=1313296 RepID=A0A1X7GGJ4_9BACL|nr:TetR/AcrR family transcriptional regulator [Paenibacillus uliginis]SMF69418.1 transcriptional regulator, TetR family [Paenibacillus uliginis N3/975]
MPKVSQEYVIKKKNTILEAGLSVCKVKPLYEITMRDIIKASGVSQGGIYRYYSDLDEILVAVINQANANADYTQVVDAIIENSNSPKESINKLFTFLGEYIKENLSTVGKIQFELTIVFANNPERQEKILSNITENESGQYLVERLFSTIHEGISLGSFQPVVSPEDLFTFIMTSIDGIVRDVVLQKCYGMFQNEQVQFDEIRLMDTLCKSVLLMLGSK